LKEAMMSLSTYSGDRAGKFQTWREKELQAGKQVMEMI
jgi:hypothetical protein